MGSSHRLKKPRLLVLLELAGVEGVVVAFGGEELFVGSAFEDAAFFDDEDAVCGVDGGEAVGSSMMKMHGFAIRARAKGMSMTL